ncbi:hypothetical protein [Streptomyces sp. RTd22]|uniref:hypothetical protein n=1 Tax=Streptomyces sp. RTd22 TaxID=1841249 RepID=UPI0007C513EA|nr:hypothetical protein [Streptomyces sp. RTd22]
MSVSEPGGRGATRIADRVVAKIASRAAREALGSGPGLLPYAAVAVRAGAARVRVAVELGYPSDMGAQCAAVRRHVTTRVGELTGMEVPEVAVTVERLHSPQLDRGKVQ